MSVRLPGSGSLANGLLGALLATLVLLSPAANAGKKEDLAEGFRLLQEMDRLVAKGAWGGVERAYINLCALDGMPVSPEVHLLAAQASRQRGDLTTTWVRLKRVLEIDGLHEAAHLQIATIEVNYAYVTVKIHRRWKGDRTLEALDLGFTPEYHTVVGLARGSLEETGRYDGLLPLGRYRLGYEDFEVIGGLPVDILVK